MHIVCVEGNHPEHNPESNMTRTLAILVTAALLVTGHGVTPLRIEPLTGETTCSM